MKLPDDLCLQGMGLRPPEADAFRTWLELRGWEAHATDTKHLGGGHLLQKELGQAFYLFAPGSRPGVLPHRFVFPGGAVGGVHHKSFFRLPPNHRVT